MYQLADNQLSEIMDLLTVIQYLWNGMVPFLVGMIGRCFRLRSWSWSCKNGLVYITVIEFNPKKT